MARRAFACCLLFFCLAAPAWADTVCHFINVGQGDAIWLALDGGYDILVDGGKPAACPTVVAYLQSHGCDSVELLVATHPDADHIGGLPAVLDAIPVTEAWLDLGDCSTAACADLRAALLAQGVVTSTVQMGDTFVWGDVTLAVLNPSAPPFADRNNQSIVLRVSHGTIDFILTGDAEAESEARLLASGLLLDAEILKVGHHGSNSSSTAAFLAAVAPQVAVISVGPNPYGHPRAEVLQRLSDAGATIYRTDALGHIVVSTDGAGYTVSPDVTPAPTLPAPSTTLFLPIVYLAPAP